MFNSKNKTMVKNHQKTGQSSLMDLLSPESRAKLQNIVKQPKIEYNSDAGYQKWVDDKNSDLKVYRDKYWGDFTKFVDSGKKYGLCQFMLSCDNIYFEKVDANPLFKHYIGWYFNTNIYSFTFLVCREKSPLKLEYEKKFSHTSLPYYSGTKVGRKIQPWVRNPIDYVNKNISTDKTVFSLIPDKDDLLITGDTMLHLNSHVEFLPVDQACKQLSYNQECFYFIPLITLDVIKAELSLKTFDSWKLIK